MGIDPNRHKSMASRTSGTETRPGYKGTNTKSQQSRTKESHAEIGENTWSRDLPRSSMDRRKLEGQRTPGRLKGRKPQNLTQSKHNVAMRGGVGPAPRTGPSCDGAPPDAHREEERRQSNVGPWWTTGEIDERQAAGARGRGWVWGIECGRKQQEDWSTEATSSERVARWRLPCFLGRRQREAIMGALTWFLFSSNDLSRR